MLGITAEIGAVPAARRRTSAGAKSAGREAALRRELARRT